MHTEHSGKVPALSKGDTRDKARSNADTADRIRDRLSRMATSLEAARLVSSATAEHSIARAERQLEFLRELVEEIERHDEDEE